MARIGGGSVHERLYRRLECASDPRGRGFLPNEIWRMVGLWFGGGVDEGSEVLVWVRAIATAILAGVIAQILVQPPGALASVPDWLRYGAVAIGVLVFSHQALDLCRRGLWRSRPCRREMVARLIAAASAIPSVGARKPGCGNDLARHLTWLTVLTAGRRPTPSTIRCADKAGRALCRWRADRVFGRTLADYLGRDLKQPSSSRTRAARRARSAPRWWPVLSPTATRCSTSAAVTRSIPFCTRSWPTIPPGISGCWHW